MLSYIATCSYITAMCDECDAVQYIVAGDFNCEPGSRFYPLFQSFATENNLCLSDSSHLSDCLGLQHIKMTQVL